MGEPRTLKIRLPVDTFAEWLRRYATEVNETGMFIPTSEPAAVGEALHFDLLLSDGKSFMAGSGKVIWIRSKKEGGEQEPGMGVRFEKLNPEGQNAVNEAMEFARQEENPFEAMTVAAHMPVAEDSWGAGRPGQRGSEEPTRAANLAAGDVDDGYANEAAARLLLGGAGGGEARFVEGSTASREAKMSGSSSVEIAPDFIEEVSEPSVSLAAGIAGESPADPTAAGLPAVGGLLDVDPTLNGRSAARRNRIILGAAILGAIVVLVLLIAIRR